MKTEDLSKIFTYEDYLLKKSIGYEDSEDCSHTCEVPMETLDGKNPPPPLPTFILSCWNTDKNTGKTEWTSRYCPEIASNISIMQLLTFPEL